MEFVELKSTKNNDVFEIDTEQVGFFEINGKSGGKDTIKLTLDLDNDFL